jgi:Uma2 family endonuclease
MQVATIDITQRYTVTDYLSWTFEQSCELIDGFIRWMSPPPNMNHAKTVSTLNYSISTYMRQSNVPEYDVYFAPVAVFLSETDVVEPDIFICKKSQLELKGCIGAPSLIIEVLSPSNRKRDLIDKLQLYEKSGVVEYWIANPKTKYITVHTLQSDHKYDQGEEYGTSDFITSIQFPDLQIDVEEVFKNLI